MDSFLSTMFENHCLQAWGDVLRESFAWSITYRIFWSRLSTCSSSLCDRLWISLTLSRCTVSKRAVHMLAEQMDMWERAYSLYWAKGTNSESIQNNPACLDYSFIKHFWCVCFDFFVVCLKKTSMEIARLSSCWLSQKFFYINCGANKFTTLIAAFSAVVCLLL